ncbi:hypothetical protein F4859DRAFT_504920 [Xylaria cf. heliscus]|nr:hypothetical protein F4859DRAFT_504920 [Xylaria cf. heliscus]
MAPPPEPAAGLEAGSTVTKPKRRFVPQLVEHTTKSSSSKRSHQDAPSDAQTDTNANDNTNTNTNANPHSDTGTSTSTSTSNSRPASNAVHKTRDASTQADADTDALAPRPPTKAIRRFAPVPIETTFDSYRVANKKNPHGPAPEPTPDPSPTTSQSSSTFSPTVAPMASDAVQAREPEKKPKRRFAPQLIETTKRAWRTGQQGPATKPTDKTDITPGTNHIYAPKPKRTHGSSGAPRPGKSGTGGPGGPGCIGSTGSPGLAHATPRSDDEALARFLTPRRQRSLNARPNTRRSTRTNSYHPELDTILSSESGNSSENDDAEAAAAPALNSGDPALSDARSDNGDSWSSRNYDLRSRRESCDEEFSGYLLGIAAREAHRQREFEQALAAFPNGMPPQGVEHFFARDNSEDDLQTGDDEPPLRHGPSQLLRRKSTDPGWAVSEMRAHAEKLARMRVETRVSLDDHGDEPGTASLPENSLWAATPRTPRRESRDSAMGSSMGPALSANSPMLFARSSPGHEKPFTPPPSTGLRASPFEIPFAFRSGGPDDGELGKMRKAASPPMLGADLTFRTCPSPQYTRMEPNQPYSQFDRLEKNQRDSSGATGLWRGYCSSKANKPDAPALHPPDLLRTPGLSWSSADPFASAFGSSMNGSSAQSPTWALGRDQTSLHKQTLSELDERILREKGRKEREEVIIAEFDDAFVTQVYNYLSLGYAATARAFDDELSKISGICVEELRKDDNVKFGKGFMLEMEIGSNYSSSDSSSIDSSEDERMILPSDYDNGRRSRHKPPRWKALKLYVREWARQHPSLNGDDDSGPHAWGVRARRGSWAI